ncbi:restriction endonuclease subunit S [Geomonas azotofigens]|uniref:restriction endonuclease subunit S n=1 Tax=Geomonas azotofigens TaxID=2843196 RepID=UPI001C128D67|nr:restriction endonuclease subunit S [Geomonas azotofigens]MBU5614465.1 restriction endonuclease subunit S [Geomonas azotofigens]
MSKKPLLVPIGDIVEKIQTWDPASSASDKPFFYIDISSVDRETKIVLPTPAILPKDAPSRARQLVKAQDILVSTVRPNLNAVAQIQDEFDGATASTGFCVLRPKKHIVDSRYLYFWVRTSEFIEEMVKRATGASYPAVSDSIIKSSKIPLPPHDEQCRISAILDKADVIHSKRQESIRLLDEFLRSTFLQMFGDPASNPKRWDKVPIKELGDVTTGNTPSREHSEYYGEGIEWIKSDNINTPFHFLTEAKENLTLLGQKVGRIVPDGSTLVTCIAGSPECIGNAALANRPVAFNQQINAVSPFEGTDPYFLYVQILVAKKLIQGQSTESMKGMVSKGKFENIPFLRPPANLQKDFGKIFIHFHNTIQKADASNQQSTNLFNSLVQRAFRGEL